VCEGEREIERENYSHVFDLGERESEIESERKRERESEIESERKRERDNVIAMFLISERKRMRELFGHVFDVGEWCDGRMV